MYERWRKTSAFFSPTAGWHAEAWTCIPGAIRQRVALTQLNLTCTLFTLCSSGKILFENNFFFIADKIKLMRLGWWMSTEIAIKLFLTASYRTLLIVVDIQLRRCRTRSFYSEGALRWSKTLGFIFRRRAVSFKNGNQIASFILLNASHGSIFVHRTRQKAPLLLSPCSRGVADGVQPRAIYFWFIFICWCFWDNPRC